MAMLPDNAPDWLVNLHNRMVALENEMAKVNPRYSADLNAARQKWEDEHPEPDEPLDPPEPEPNPAPNPPPLPTY